MPLRLKEITAYDLKTIYKWKLQEANPEYYTCRPVQPLANFEVYSKRILRKIASKSLIYMGVWSEEGVLLGTVSGFDINHRNQSMEFGYYFSPSNRGQGYGSESVGLFIDFVFKQWNLHKLYATTASKNQASIRILEKYHFQLDGRMREHYWLEGEKQDQLVYSLLRHEWLKNRFLP